MKLKILLLSLLGLLSSCATQVPDVPILTRLNASQCFYVYTISDKQGIVDDDNLLNGKTCIDYLQDDLIIPVDSWVEIKKFILKICNKTKSCGEVGDWNNRIDVLSSKAVKK
jgi:hypothetical protein